ncbi:MAG: TetR/AcrR family transcriptional regulator [Alcanivorax sp.]|nr:TetR/AcrR family transcriptional regulator [Alcanivorax sp.]
MPSNDTPTVSFTGDLPVTSGDATHEKILDAGLAQFTEFGLRRTSMDDVAGQAGVGRATAYRRFGDKHRLIQAVILRECQHQLALIEADIRALDNPGEALLESFVLAVTRAHAHPLLVRLLSSEPEDILPALTVQWPVMMALFRNRLAGQIQKAHDAGYVKVQDASELAELMLRLMQSLLLSPEGVFSPRDEASIRRLTQCYLRPWLH